MVRKLVVALGCAVLCCVTVSADNPAGAPPLEREFAALDRSVRALPRAASIGATVSQLNRLARNDRERARVVYTWLTENIAYDADAFFSGRQAVTEAEGVFRVRRSVCQGYAELFRELATGLGLEVEVISGYAKGYSYREGAGFSQTNHAWNAVKMDGAWHLVDATWGAGYVDGRRFVRDFSEFWFDPDPLLFRMTHLPESSSWQLVEEPITMAQYVREPYIESYVFENLHALGLSDAQVLAALAEGKRLPQAYPYDGHAIRVLRAPLTGAVPAGQPLEVRLELPGVEQAAFINNGSFVYMERSGSIFVGRISPERGDLRASVRITHRGSNSFWPVLVYRVE
jgi:hypothetical protein